MKKLLRTKEDCLSCVFYINSKQEGDQITSILHKLGYKFISNRVSGYIRTEHEGNSLSYDSDRTAWKRCAPYPEKYTEFEFEEAMVAFGLPVSASDSFAGLENFVITPITESYRLAVQDKLIKFGYIEMKGSSVGHTYFRYLNDKNKSWGDGSMWKDKQPTARMISPKEFLGMTTVQRPQFDFRNLVNVGFVLPNKEEQDKLLTKLFELGYQLNNACELWHEHLTNWRIKPGKELVGGNSAIPAYEFLDYKSIINTNNTPLNNKTDGNKIIVREPLKTITGRQRPEGTSISGKTRPTTIRIGHLSHRAINS